MRGHAHSGPDQPGNRSVPASSRNSANHQTGENGSDYRNEWQVDSLGRSQRRQSDWAELDARLSQKINCLHISAYLALQTKKKEKREANHLGCVAPVCTPASAAAESVIANSLPVPCCPNGNSGCIGLQFANQWFIIWR